MIYLVHVEWQSTKGNHAGMTYLANYLEKENNDVKAFKVPVWPFKGAKYVIYIIHFIFIARLLLSLKANDSLFLMEYLEPRYSRQHLYAKFIRLFHRKVRIVGLIHLSGTHLLELYQSEKTIKQQLKLIDNAIVFGTSLSEFLQKLGLKKSTIEVVHHYVDDNFYSAGREVKSGNLRVLFSGSLKRDFNLLLRVVKSLPHITFDITMGRNNLRSSFEGYSNVNLYPYLKEEELRDLMKEADISLSIMIDTVGSNVIVTSMASSMAMIVSDVGSIRDYVDDTNSILCNKEEDYIEALESCNSNRKQLETMKENSRRKAENMNLKNFNFWFNQYFKHKKS